MTYTKTDCGCWIDDGFGMGHVMKELASMMQTTWSDFLPARKNFVVRERRLVTTGSLEELYEVLLGGDPDVLSDIFLELDDATDYLQRHTEKGLVWLWDCGGLILATEEEWNDGTYSLKRKGTIT
jgi:hypothetical protein